MILSRRSLIGGIGALLAAPAIVRASSLMAVRPLGEFDGFTSFFDWPVAQHAAAIEKATWFGSVIQFSDDGKVWHDAPQTAYDGGVIRAPTEGQYLRVIGTFRENEIRGTVILGS